jgi:hypothetical protein
MSYTNGEFSIRLANGIRPLLFVETMGLSSGLMALISKK